MKKRNKGSTDLAPRWDLFSPLSSRILIKREVYWKCVSMLLCLVSQAWSLRASRVLTLHENVGSGHLLSTIGPNSHGARLQQCHRRHHPRRLSRTMLLRMLRTKPLSWIHRQPVAQPWLHSEQAGYLHTMLQRPAKRIVRPKLPWIFWRPITKEGVRWAKILWKVLQKQKTYHLYLPS